jgi:hypothetical protein
MTMPTFSAGQRLTASDLQILADQIDSLTAPGWVSYGSTFAELIDAYGTDPTQGDSTVYARYRRPAGSDMCSFYMKVDIDTGGGFSAGTGAWRFHLPYDASSAASMTFRMAVNESGVLIRTGATYRVSDGRFEATCDESTAIGELGIAGSGWTTGDWMTFAGTYRCA